VYDPVDQEWAAQRAVQAREAQHNTVEAILAEAALANAQLTVARAVLQAKGGSLFFSRTEAPVMHRIVGLREWSI
jgi:hypothetical protein